MATPAISSSRVCYIGPVRVASYHFVSGGNGDTLELPFQADSVNNNRILAVTSSPLSAASVDARITITSVTSNRPTITINAGAANDQHIVHVWNWG